MKNSMKALPSSRTEAGPRQQYEWSARHLRDRALPVHSWHQVQVLIGLVGTTEWPWLTVQTIPTAYRGRRAACTGFADVLTVDVCEWGPGGGVHRIRRLGCGPADDRWVDVGPNTDRCAAVYRSQVLSPQAATLAFHSWLELGHVDGFTAEDL